MEHILDYKKLGQRIRQSREDAGMTQAALGERCNLSTSYIGHIERGTRIASIDTLYGIATALGVSTDYLLLDASPDSESLTMIAAAINGKDPRKRKTFIAAVKALADKIDEL